MATLVSVDNYVRAETARMFEGILAMTGGLNQFAHYRAPTAIDAQPVIRMQRDTLYSGAILDISEGATLTIPDPGNRYMSMMVVNEDHYINEIFHSGGTYELTTDTFDTPYVHLSMRLLVDPRNPEDLAEAHALQDALVVDAGSAKPYTHREYDEDSLKATTRLLLELAEAIPDAGGMFGPRAEVDAIRHLIGTAMGWGGLPESEAVYIAESAPRSAGNYKMTVRDVPVDGFWSISIYNKDGFFEENPYDSYNLNSVTATPNEDGSFTLNMALDGEGLTNHLYVMDGWNYVFRCYLPHQAVKDGTWTPPAPELVA
jgi:hypothetical protein